MRLYPGRLSHLLVLVIALVDVVWIAVSPVDVPMGQFLAPVWRGMLLLVGVLWIGRLDHSNARMETLFSRLGDLFQGLLFLQVSWIALRIFNHVSMTSNYPYADDRLIAWDSHLPWTWEAYFHFVRNNDAIFGLMDHSYTSLTLVSFMAFPVLVFQKDRRRGRFFLDTFLVTALVCTVIGLFLPAKAAVATYHGDAATWANLHTLPGVYHLESLERLRSGVPFSLDLDALPGLVTFPSLHTAAGIVLMIGFWRTALFPLVLAYSLVMIASTPILGGHYFVDLIAGTAIAAVVAFVFASLPFYRGLFRKASILQTVKGAEPGTLTPAAG